MFRFIQTRLTIEKLGTHIRYYPRLIDADVTYQYPMYVPTAEMTISTNVSLYKSGYISEIRTGDIVKLEVSIKTNPRQKTVWQTLYEGLIETINSVFNVEDRVKISCVGFLIESTYALLEGTATWSTSFDAVDLIRHMYEGSTARIRYTAGFCTSGITIPKYDITAYQTFANEVLEEMEKLSGYKYYIDVSPVRVGGNWQYCNITWKPIPTTPQDVFKIIEGTPRFLSADFTVTEEELRAYARVTGATPDGGTTPYHGEATSVESVAGFGKRAMIESYDWVNSDELCGKIAEGLVLRYMGYGVTGQVKMILTPEAKLCEMVNVTIPSIDLNGAPVEDWNFNMFKVNHHLSAGDCYTTVDLGSVKRSEYDYYNKINKKVATCKKNQVTKK